jgi:hypothetical protein
MKTMLNRDELISGLLNLPLAGRSKPASVGDAGFGRGCVAARMKPLPESADAFSTLPQVGGSARPRMNR